MVAGIKFLSKKAFNPQNLSNQKRVWEAEQQKKEKLKQAVQREKQLQRERDDEELAKARGETVKLSFMYEQPPGIEQKMEQEHEDGKPPAKASSDSLTERQPGDDDAAAAFRRILARASAAEVSIKATATAAAAASEGSVARTVMQGTTFDPMEDRTKGSGTAASLSALEKAVGRRHDGKNGLSLDEQIQRFPALANAPRASGISSSVGVTFKPLGTQIRNVRCLACGIWGHSRGDRECGVSGWDPFASSVTPARTSHSESAAIPTGVTRREDELERGTRKRSKKDKNHSARRRRRHDDDDSCNSSNRSSNDDDEERRRRRRKKESKRSKEPSSSSGKRRCYDTDDDDDDDRKRRHNKSHKKQRRDR